MTHKKLLERNRKITDALQNGAKVTDLAPLLSASFIASSIIPL